MLGHRRFMRLFGTVGLNPVHDNINVSMTGQRSFNVKRGPKTEEKLEG